MFWLEIHEENIENTDDTGTARQDINEQNPILLEQQDDDNNMDHDDNNDGNDEVEITDIKPKIRIPFVSLSYEELIKDGYYSPSGESDSSVEYWPFSPCPITPIEVTIHDEEDNLVNKYLFTYKLFF